MEQMSVDACKAEDESLDICLEPLNLTGINTFCKIEIFKYLDWQNLLNIAETSNQLKSSACEVYKQKYGKKYGLTLHPNRG